MKIAYITKSIIPSRTANSVHVMKMCQALSENGNEVLLLSIGNGTKSHEKLLNIYKYYDVKNIFVIKSINCQSVRYIRSLLFALEVMRALRQFKPDLVYGRDLFGCFISSFFYKTGLEVHAPMSSMIERVFFDFMVRNPYYLKTTVISDALLCAYLDFHNKTKNAYVVAHDGADEVEDFDLRIKLLGSDDSLNVGYVGHLYKGKGIEVIQSIARYLPDVDFHIIGGLDKDIEYWKNIIKDDNVYFYGYVSHSNVSCYMNSLDVCLLPNQEIVLPFGGKTKKHNISDYTSPLKMFEYMAHKKMIIASSLNVLKEVLHEKNSLLVVANDYEAWISAIENSKDIGIRQKLSNKAFEDFIENYTWKQRAKSIVSNLFDN